MDDVLASASPQCPHQSERGDNLRPGLLQDGGAAPSVHRSSVYNSRDMEATSTYVDRGMDKDVAHTYNGTLLSH